jgi:hypothetical protein
MKFFIFSINFSVFKIKNSKIIKQSIKKNFILRLAFLAIGSYFIHNKTLKSLNG